MRKFGLIVAVGALGTLVLKLSDDPSATLSEHLDKGLSCLVGMLCAMIFSPTAKTAAPIAPDEPPPAGHSSDSVRIQRIRKKCADHIRRLNAARMIDQARAEQGMLWHILLCAAVAFSLWSVLAVAAVTPNQWPTRHAYFQLSGVVVVCAVFTVVASARTTIEKGRIVLYVGMLGIATSGLISLAVSLPYVWSDLSAQPSPITGLNLAHFVMLLRLLVFPIVGTLVAAMVPIGWFRTVQ